MPTVRSILFLCPNNATLSQMAEALARLAFDGRVEVHSAGPVPTVIHPYAIGALQEMGIDISHHRAKLVEAIDLDQVDLAINLSHGDLTKRLPPKIHRLQWPMPDPAVADPKLSMGAHFDKFKRSCEELQARIGELRDRYVSLD